jgi:hypothetical protein
MINSIKAAQLPSHYYGSININNCITGIAKEVHDKLDKLSKKMLKEILLKHV